MIRYSERYDAMYDDEKLLWIERTCSDPSCEFCIQRPLFPTLDLSDRIIDKDNVRLDNNQR